MSEQIIVGKWEIKVCGSSMDLVHGFYHIITEYCFWLDNECICLNFANGGINCFSITAEEISRRHENGVKIREFNIDKREVEKITKYLELKKEITKLKDYMETQ